MSNRRLWGCLCLFFLLALFAWSPNQTSISSTQAQNDQLLGGRNVNMVSGTTLPGGDPWLQRQNEPSIAVSTRNPLHLLAGANDYRTVDMAASEGELPGIPGLSSGDAWLGVYLSVDGGQSWRSTLLPGFPQDSSSAGLGSPFKTYSYSVASDPIVRAGTNGMFYYGGMAFQRVANGNSAVFISRYIDNDNSESGNPVKYLDTKIVASGNALAFVDKPWVAVDIPRHDSTITIDGQAVSAAPVYVAYTVFYGAGSSNVTSELRFLRSTNCGQTWSSPIILDKTDTKGKSQCQGASIAVAPDDGTVYVAWRVFDKNAKKGSIYCAKSTTNGASFREATEVAKIKPFDQGVSTTSFRSNGYPTMTVDNSGIVYIAWSERAKTNGPAHVVVATGDGGTNWSKPQEADSSGQGHQFMPSIACAGGRLLVVWYDQRNDASGRFDEFIDDIYLVRHTVDVFMAEAKVRENPNFKAAVQVSRYLWALKDLGAGKYAAEQVQYNPVNYPLFKGGTVPFIGDYIDVVPAPPFLLRKNGRWRYDTKKKDIPLFHIAWTDNRDVRPPQDNDWTKYNPPTSSQPGWPLTPPTGCLDVSRAGMRNQNIYTSVVARAVEFGAVGNSKPLGTLGTNPKTGTLVPRAFAVFIRNTTAQTLLFRLTVASDPQFGNASFLEFGSLKTLDLGVAPFSSVSRPVFVTSTDPKDSATIDVDQIDKIGGSLVADGWTGLVFINPDDTAPDVGGDLAAIESHTPNIENPNIINWGPGTPNIINPNIINPNIINPNIENPNIINPNIINPNIENPNIVNPNIVNPNIINPNIINPNIINPNIENPNIINSSLADAAVTDIQWKVTNAGNTVSSYTFKTFSKEAVPAGIYLQLLIYRVHYTPAVNATSSSSCDLKQERHDELVANIANPNIINPNIVNPNIENPNIENPNIENATFSLAPGEEASVILRVVDPTPYQAKALASGNVFNPQSFASSVGAATTSQAVDSTDDAAGKTEPPAAASKLVIANSSLPDGIVHQSYSATLTALGGAGSLSWELNAGELPSGLLLSAGGLVHGTPDTAGTSYFIVKVSDGVDFDTQRFSITINASSGPGPLSITTTTLPSGVKGYWYGATLEASGGVYPRLWSLYSGSLPPGLVLDGNGMIGGTPTANGVFNITVRVVDAGSPQQSATKSLTLQINASTGTTVTISGMVYGKAEASLDGVVLRGLPNTPITGLTGVPGYYEDKVPSGWSGTVIPFKTGYSFAPPSKTYSNITTSQTGQDYNIAAGAAAKLAFGQQPTNTIMAGPITPAVTVEIQDAAGNRVTTATNSVTLSLRSAGTAKLSGTTSKAAIGGIATFSDLTVDLAGSGYLLRANSGSLTEVDSIPFNITGAVPSIIQVETAPDGSGAIVPAQNIAAGSSITVYAISRGAGGNFIENVAADSWSLINKNGGVVDGDLVVAGGGKSAVFTGHLVGSAQIHAAKSPLTSVDSGVLTVTGGAAGKIALTGPPSADAGFISQAFTITSQDSMGIPVNVPQDAIFHLTSNTIGIGTFYSDSRGTTPITQAQMPSGQSTAQFYYMDNRGGTPTITATWVSGGTNLGYATRQLAVRTGAGRIAFTSLRDGNNEIYIMNADGTGQTRLTNNPASDEHPSLSPDGSKITFMSLRDGNYEIYVMNADGSGEMNLTNNPADDMRPSWSADGRKIVFQSVRDGNNEIYIMNADGSGQTNLTKNPASDEYPSLSPDGTKVAFMSLRDGNYEIYVMNADGSGQTNLTKNTGEDLHPGWSADGSKIVFQSVRDGNNEIYIMNADGTGQTRLTNNTVSDEFPSLSPDGAKIAFMSLRDGNYEIYVMNADGSGQTNLTNNPGQDMWPSWGGSKLDFIAFQSNRDGNAEIYVMNADGSGQTRLTNNTAPDVSPCFSPDGNKIAFGSSRDGNYEIYIMNADGSGQTRLTNNTANDYFPCFSPDGNKIAFASYRDGNYEIYIMNADGSGQTNLTNNATFDGYPSFSPDGSRIVFVSARDTDTNAQIYVMNADGSGQTRLTNNTASDAWPSFSPDGSRIVFMSYQDGNNEIYVMNADGSGQTRLTNNTASDAVPRFSPDGSRIAFESDRDTDTNYQIYVMNADGSGQTRLTNNTSYDEVPSWRPHPKGPEVYEFVTKWGSYGTGDGQFNQPWGIAVDRSGNVYVVDSLNYRIQKFSSTGTFVTQWGSSGTGDGQFIYPCGIAVDSSGNVYVVDSRYYRIQKFSSTDGINYTFVTKWGINGTGDGQFNSPLTIAVDSSGYIYVGDYGNNRIQKFSSTDGINYTFVTKWGSNGTGDGQFNSPYGITVDSSGNVYVVDFGNNRIQKFSSTDGINYTFVTKWGSNGTGDGQFNSPIGIAVDSSGYIYVGDYGNNRIQKFTSTGTFVTQWGSYGTGDGQFNFPIGIAVDNSGYVYVLDAGNERIQKFRKE
jgi:Tol biopolymer transport system component/DNA-binding beta-propeller fold protein YncE